MACILRECSNCGHADTKYSRPNSGPSCPKCGCSMSVYFDEERDHDDRYEYEADMGTIGEDDADYFEQAGIRGFGDR